MIWVAGVKKTILFISEIHLILGATNWQFEQLQLWTDFWIGMVNSETFTQTLLQHGIPGKLFDEITKDPRIQHGAKTWFKILKRKLLVNETVKQNPDTQFWHNNLKPNSFT